MEPIAFEKVTLSNGLDVILHQDHSIPLVAVNVWYHVGSKDEEVGHTGFAHLFEHMMFEGSKHHNSSHFEPLQEAGANLNGSTTPDRTNYWEDVPSNYLELALWGIYQKAPVWLATLLDWAWLQQAGLQAGDRSWMAFTVLSAAAWLYAWLFVDMNYTSMHRFYRDRLSRAYLARHDSLKLSGLKMDSSAAPYHLINATLNLPDGEDPEIERRKADFFLFSKHFL